MLSFCFSRKERTKIAKKAKTTQLTFSTRCQVLPVPGKVHVEHLAGVSFECRVQPWVLVVGICRTLLFDIRRNARDSDFPATTAGFASCCWSPAGGSCFVSCCWGPVTVLLLSVFVLFVSVGCVICKGGEKREPILEHFVLR